MPTSTTPLRRHVAIIGAGASGLAAARELHWEGHRVVVFERGAGVGGTWIYTADTESDPLGLDPTRTVVQSSLYDSLRTNLPRECMGFLDYPFVAGGGDGGGDRRRYPRLQEVLRYLEDFARDFGIWDVVRLRTEVVRVWMEEDGRWAVGSRRTGDGDGGDDKVEVYDAVVVCNGHFTEPRIAEIRGVDAWPGKQMHSHNYRVPDPFHDQVVVIVGGSASAIDISRDIARFAKEVHIASRSETEQTPRKQPGYANMWLHSMKEPLKMALWYSKMEVRSMLMSSCIVLDGIVTVDDNRVGPLYKHIFPPSLAPCLSFIGLPWRGMPLPTIELQSKWVAGVLSGRIVLPPREEMMADVEEFYLKMEVVGWPKRYTHNIMHNQFEYTNWLANESGCPGMAEWRKLMFVSNYMNLIDRLDSYRDEWDDDDLVLEAHEDFKQYL